MNAEIVNLKNWKEMETLVSMPHITFYPHKEMYMQFYEANFPNAEYGFGVGIGFQKDTVSFVDVPNSDNEIEED